MTPAEARLEIDRITRTPEEREPYLRGDPRARERVAALHKRATATEGEARASQERDQDRTYTQERFGVSQAVFDQLDKGEVTLDLVDEAVQTIQNIKSSADLRRRQLDGDKAVNRQHEIAFRTIAKALELGLIKKWPKL
jgi:hypothetical protein